MSIMLFMAFRFDVCKITTCAAYALIVPLNCTSTYMFCTFDIKSKTYIMHCPNLCLISSLSRVLFIMPDSVTSVSWIHVLYVKGEHSGIQEQYCVVHVKQIYIIIAKGFCWMISKVLCLMETGSVDCVLKDSFHLTISMMTMIPWNVSKNYQNLLILQLDCTIVPNYSTLLTSMRTTTISLNIMVI